MHRWANYLAVTSQSYRLKKHIQSLWLNFNDPWAIRAAFPKMKLRKHQPFPVVCMAAWMVVGSPWARRAFGHVELLAKSSLTAVQDAGPCVPSAQRHSQSRHPPGFISSLDFTSFDTWPPGATFSCLGLALLASNLFGSFFSFLIFGSFFLANLFPMTYPLGMVMAWKRWEEDLNRSRRYFTDFIMRISLIFQL